ncbi:MAG: PDZ domain-containing protein [Acidobacteriota bacterium]
MNQTIDRRYLVALAILAALVLTGGSLLRPEKKSAVDQPSSSEIASLQRAVRGDELERLAGTLSERASAASRYVIYLPGDETSGVLWDVAGGVATPGGPGRLLTLTGSGSRVSPPALARSRAGEAQWLLIVGRSAESKPIWSAALGGGSYAAACDGVGYRERVVNVPLGRELLGAGVFDLDGALAGIVCQCQNTYHVVSSGSIGELLKAQSAPPDLWALYGIRVSPFAPAGSDIFGNETGLLLSEISIAGTGYEAGLRAGDLIVAVADQPARSPGDVLNTIREATEPASVTIVRPGQQKTSRVTLPAGKAVGQPDGYGMKLLPPLRSLSQVSVSMNTAAYRAGLRTGDFIVQTGSDRNPSPGQLRRVLGQESASPLLIVFNREGVEHAVWVSR